MNTSAEASNNSKGRQAAPAKRRSKQKAVSQRVSCAHEEAAAEAAATFACAQGEALMNETYQELRRIAAALFRDENPGHTLQPTALVNEAYIRLFPPGRQRCWSSKAHFFRSAARTIRRVLIDHARKKRALKRGGRFVRVELDDAEVGAYAPESDLLLALDAALDRLAKLDPRMSEVFTLRFFGGMTLRETAEVLEVSETTLKAEWNLARAWLRWRLSSAV